MIQECEFAQRLGNVVKMRLRDKDGKFRNHWHRYKTEEKAEMMFKIFGKAVQENGGTV